MVCSGEEIASVLDRILHPPHTMFIHTHTHTHTRARARARVRYSLEKLNSLPTEPPSSPNTLTCAAS